MHGRFRTGKRISNKLKGVELYATKEHHRPYLRDHYSDTIDPLTGKYNGWDENSWKDKSLKKKHRQAGKKFIEDEVLNMNEACKYCGSHYCEDPDGCYEADTAEYEWEQYLMEEDLRLMEEEQEERYRQEMEDEIEEDWYYPDFHDQYGLNDYH